MHGMTPMDGTFSPPPPRPSPGPPSVGHHLAHPGRPDMGGYAGDHGAPASAVAIARRRGWWSRNWKWAVPTGITTLVALGVGLVFALIGAVLGIIKSTEVYQTALSEARSDFAVVAAIGTPIEAGTLVQGNIEVNPGSGYADLAIPIEGPGGSATVHVQAEKHQGEWAYVTMTVAVHDTGETVDLLADW